MKNQDMESEAPTKLIHLFKSKLMQSDAKKFCLLFDVRSHLEKVNKIAIPENRM